jgi:hypothetical protein
VAVTAPRRASSPGHGRVAAWTAYVGWLDPYVQMGLMDGASLTT